MSIFGKDHYFCITTFSCLEVNIWISSSEQDNTDYFMCQLYAVFMSTSIIIYVRGEIRDFYDGFMNNRLKN